MQIPNSNFKEAKGYANYKKSGNTNISGGKNCAQSALNSNELCENKLDICCFFTLSSQDLILLSSCSFFFVSSNQLLM